MKRVIQYILKLLEAKEETITRPTEAKIRGHKKCKLAMSDTRTALHSSLCEARGGGGRFPLAPPVPEALSSVKVMNGSSKKVQNIQM